jgi:flagellar motor switch protein FliN/FliY
MIMMKRVLIFALTSMMLAACANKGVSSDSPSSSESQDTDSERARKIAERKARSAAILAQANASSPKRITVIYGSTVKKSAEMDQLKEDSVIELDRASDEIVEILADGKPFAMGKLEVSNGKASVRIVRMITD